MRKIISWLLAFVAVFSFNYVHASAPYTQYTPYHNLLPLTHAYNADSPFRDTTSESCTAHFPFMSGKQSENVSTNEGPALYAGTGFSDVQYCYLDLKKPVSGGAHGNYFIPFRTELRCPDHSKPVNGVCESVCEAGNQFWANTGSTKKATICINGCQSSAGQTSACATGTDGVKVCGSEYVSESVNCVGNTPDVQPDPGVCPFGMKNISADPTKLNCVRGDKPKPTCWIGSHNVSTDPDMAICVPDMPDKKPPIPDATPAPSTKTTDIADPLGTRTTSETTTQSAASPSSTTKTTTITETKTVNNTTTTTSTTIIQYEPPSAASSGGTYTDGGPKECGTPGLPKCEISDEGAPGLPDQTSIINGKITEGEAAMQSARDGVAGGMQADRDKFFSWVWTPPVGTCSAFTGTVHGFEINWDLCGTVANIRSVLAWLLALFSAFQVYGLLFKRA